MIFDLDLHCVEVETMLLRYIEHIEMNLWIFVTGEANETYLPRLSGSDDRFHRAPFIEDSIRVLETDDFVMLEQIDMVNLEPL